MAAHGQPLFRSFRYSHSTCGCQSYYYSLVSLIRNFDLLYTNYFKIPHDAYCHLLGLYSRGKSHVLRLSIPLQILLSLWNDDETDIQNTDEASYNGKGTDPVAAPDSKTDSEHLDDSDGTDEVEESACQQNANLQSLATVGPAAINIAHSIVDTCLSQLCKCYIFNLSFLEVTTLNFNTCLQHLC